MGKRAREADMRPGCEQIDGGQAREESVARPASVRRITRDMQRRFGNAAVERMAGEARPATPIAQARLVVTRPDDRHEQEADQAAAQLSAAGPESVQRSTLSPVGAGGGIPVSPAIESGIQAARSGGQPLPGGVRGQMEGALGADLGGVRLHTGPAAHALNVALQARAFTTGRDIFFRHSEYAPESAGGRELLAHELAHVVQQGGRHTTGGVVQRWPITLTVSGEKKEYEDLDMFLIDTYELVENRDFSRIAVIRDALISLTMSDKVDTRTKSAAKEALEWVEGYILNKSVISPSALPARPAPSVLRASATFAPAAPAPPIRVPIDPEAEYTPITGRIMPTAFSVDNPLVDYAEISQLGDTDPLFGVPILRVIAPKAPPEPKKSSIKTLWDKVSSIEKMKRAILGTPHHRANTLLTNEITEDEYYSPLKQHIGIGLLLREELGLREMSSHIADLFAPTLYRRIGMAINSLRRLIILSNHLNVHFHVARHNIMEAFPHEYSKPLERALGQFRSRQEKLRSLGFSICKETEILIARWNILNSSNPADQPYLDMARNVERVRSLINSVRSTLHKDIFPG